MNRKTLRYAIGTVVAAAALVAPSAASAANVIPNPGFEADCGGVPCSWVGVDGVTTRDTTNPHSGSASIRLAIGGGSGAHQATAHSLCTNATISSGLRTVSFAYRATAGVTGLAMTVSLYGNTGCTGGIAQVSFDVNSVNTSGTWQVVTAGINVPSTAQSFLISLGTGCASGCNGTQATNFDDVVLDSGAPTAATLVSFRACHTTKGVQLTWKTAATPQLAGFNVYRGTKKLNRTIVRSVRGTLGASAFSWLDRSAGHQAHATYRLQAVYLDGTRAWLGSTRV